MKLFQIVGAERLAQAGIVPPPPPPSRPKPPEEGQLLDVLGPNISMTGYCQSGGWWNWEEKIATPRLKELGYTTTPRGWWSADSDSFGPLVRAVEVQKDGISKILYYG